MLTCPSARAPVRGVSAITAATARFLINVRRFRTGVYSSVAAAEKATMARKAGGSCTATIRAVSRSRKAEVRPEKTQCSLRRH